MRSEERERRWRAAFARALDGPAMPADLKAALLRRARRARRPGWGERVREALSLPAWAYGTGLAAAAAAALLLVRLERPEPLDAPVQEALGELWSEDAGGEE